MSLKDYDFKKIEEFLKRNGRIVITNENLKILLGWAQGAYDDNSHIMHPNDATNLKNSIVEAHKLLGNSKEARKYNK